MSDFYVYGHMRLDNGEIFYIGKGRGRRAHYVYERNQHWTNVYRKCGMQVFFFEENLTEPEAFRLEKHYIALCSGGPYLTNKTPGGEGSAGYKFTPEQIEQLRLSHLGNKPSERCRQLARARMTGRIASERERLLSSQRMKGNRHGAKRRITPELRRKLSEANGNGRSPHTDRTEYLFMHADGRAFYGTRWELKKTFGDCVRALFYTNPNKSVAGWRLCDVANAS